MALCRPLKKLSSAENRFKMIILPWIPAGLLSVPQLIIWSKNYKTNTCNASFGDETVQNRNVAIYTCLFFVTIYVIPFLTFVYFYGRIGYTIWKNDPQKLACGTVVYKFNGTGHISVITKGRVNCSLCDSVQEVRKNCNLAMSKAKLKTIKLAIVVCLTYLVCWAPFFATHLIWIIAPQLEIISGKVPISF